MPHHTVFISKFELVYLVMYPNSVSETAKSADPIQVLLMSCLIWVYTVSSDTSLFAIYLVYSADFNLCHSLGRYSRPQTDIFLVFPRKQTLTFHTADLFKF